MKKHSLLSTILLIILMVCSSQIHAIESQNDLTNLIFSDTELTKLLSVRPYDEKQHNKALNRFSQISQEVIKQHLSEKVPQENIAKTSECLANTILTLMVSTQAFALKLAKPEQLVSDYHILMNLVVCTNGKAFASKEADKSTAISVNDLLLDFSNYYGKEIFVKGYIVYNDMGSYLFHSKGNMNAVFIKNERLPREAKKYLMGCSGGCEVTMKIKPSESESDLMKTAFGLSLVK